MVSWCFRYTKKFFSSCSCRIWMNPSSKSQMVLLKSKSISMEITNSDGGIFLFILGLIHRNPNLKPEWFLSSSVEGYSLLSWILKVVGNHPKNRILIWTWIHADEIVRKPLPTQWFQFRGFCHNGESCGYFWFLSKSIRFGVNISPILGYACLPKFWRKAARSYPLNHNNAFLSLNFKKKKTSLIISN